MLPARNREDKAGAIGEASHLRVGEHAEEQVMAELQQRKAPWARPGAF